MTKNHKDSQDTKDLNTSLNTSLNTQVKITVGERIKEAISNEPVKAFARRSGVPDTSLRNYISNKKKPGLDALAAISDATGITVDWLAKGKGIKYIRDLKHAQERLNGAPPRAYGEFPSTLKPYEKRLDALIHYLAMIEDEAEVELILTEVTLRAEKVVELTELKHLVNEMRAEYLKRNSNNK